jgi:glycine cleavage system protein P-like pyridoxal-binding family
MNQNLNLNYRNSYGDKLLMESSRPGRRGVLLPSLDVPKQPLPDQSLLREDLLLPELSQPEVVRYFTRLSHMNYSIDTEFYPLGSCTMKYNPKINDQLASVPGLASLRANRNASNKPRTYGWGTSRASWCSDDQLVSH